MKVVLDLPGDIQMKVILERMVQKNRKTGWERRLRMAVKGYRETGVFSCWYGNSIIIKCSVSYAVDII